VRNAKLATTAQKNERNKRGKEGKAVGEQPSSSSGISDEEGGEKNWGMNRKTKTTKEDGREERGEAAAGFNSRHCRAKGRSLDKHRR
jgi:hypothetical protein